MRTSKIFACLAALAVPALLTVANGVEGGGDLTLMAAKGRVTFRIYCSNCHGAEARGDGSLAELLTVMPADLTAIAQRNGGLFPTDRVRAMVDGRETAPGHGLKEMPIWGNVFQKTLQPTWTEESDESRAGRKIDELVEFLNSIQEPKAAAQ